MLEPSFTARAYRTRNIVCGQYGSWAAEMHMLRMSVVGYFECSDAAVGNLTQGAERVAAESRNGSPRLSINCDGVAKDKAGTRADSNRI